MQLIKALQIVSLFFGTVHALLIYLLLIDKSIWFFIPMPLIYLFQYYIALKRVLLEVLIKLSKLHPLGAE